MWEYLLLIGPVLFLVVVMILERITPNYDWRNNYVSELALGKYGWVQKINLVVYGIWLVGLSFVLANGSGVWGWYPGILAGLVTVCAGILDTNPKGQTKTLIGTLHDWTYYIGTLATGSVFLLVGWELRNNLIFLLFSWLIAIFNLAWWILAPKFGVEDGVAQRVVIYLSIFWLVTMALWTMWRY